MDKTGIEQILDQGDAFAHTSPSGQTGQPQKMEVPDVPAVGTPVLSSPDLSQTQQAPVPDRNIQVGTEPEPKNMPVSALHVQNDTREVPHIINWQDISQSNYFKGLGQEDRNVVTRKYLDTILLPNAKMNGLDLKTVEEQFYASANNPPEELTADYDPFNKNITPAEYQKELYAYKDNWTMAYAPEKVEQWKQMPPMGPSEAWAKLNKWEMLPYLNGVTALQDMKMYDILRRLDTDPKRVSLEDAQKARAYLDDMAELQVRGLSWGGNMVYQGLRMPAYGIEFAGALLTLGALGVGSAEKTVAKEAVKKGMKYYIGKGIEKAVAAGVKGAAITLVNPQQVAKQYYGTKLNDYMAITDKGERIYQAAQAEPFTALMRAFGSAWIENTSEMTGSELLNPALRVTGRAVLPKSLLKAFDGLAKDIGEKSFTAAVARYGYDGVFAEFGEERVGDVMRVALNLDQNKKWDFEGLGRAIFPKWDQVQTELGLITIYGASSYAGAGAIELLKNRGMTYTEAKEVVSRMSEDAKEKMVREYTVESPAQVTQYEAKLKSLKDMLIDTGMTEEQAVPQVAIYDAVIETAAKKEGRVRSQVFDDMVPLVTRTGGVSAEISEAEVDAYIKAHEGTSKEAAKEAILYQRWNDNEDVDNEQRTAAEEGMPLYQKATEPQYQHRMLRATAEEDLKTIMSEGWEKDLVEEFNRPLKPFEAKFSMRPNVSSLSLEFNGQFNKTKKGEIVLLPPNDMIVDGKNGSFIKPGWKPKPEEVVRIEYDGQDPREIYRRTKAPLYQNAPAFYSRLMKVIEEKMPNAADPATIKGIIKDIKAEEREWSGIDGFLEGKKKVTKQEIVDFLKGNEIQVVEVVKEENTDTKYSNWQLPGGENYREILFTLPTAIDNKKLSSDYEKAKQAYNKYIENADNTYGAEWSYYPSEVQKKAKELQKIQNDAYMAMDRGKILSQDNQYKSPHWSEANVLAHARLNDRTDNDGKKVLFVEEIQSDWHQKGRKKGYAKAIKKVADKTKFNNALKLWEEARDRLDILFGNGKKLSIKIIRDIGSLSDYFLEKEYADYLSTEEGKSAIKKFREIQREMYLEREKWQDEEDAIAATNKNTVPDAPFKKTWHEFVFKRLVRMAAEQGYDRIAWTTGEQQADRYDLGKQIDEIDYTKTPEGNVQLRVFKDITEISSELKIPYEIPLSEVENYVGKDIAKKINEANNVGKDGNVRGELKGVDLRVGGEGMSGFYDKMLVDYANKFGKKFGAKVQESNVQNKTYSDRTFSGRFPTREQLEQVYLLSSKGGRDIKVSPITGKKTELAINRVYVTNALAQIINEIDTGMSVEQAIQLDADDDIADIFGFNVEWKEKKETVTVHSMDITDAMKKEVLEVGQPLFQGDGKRGAYYRQDNIIELFKNADRSTFIHESAHSFFEYYLKRMPDELSTIMDWCGMKGKDPTKMTAQEYAYVQERFASGFEAYLMEGKAPSSKLAQVFETFKNWLLSIYKSLKGLSDSAGFSVEISDEIREFFDDMLTSDRQVQIDPNMEIRQYDKDSVLYQDAAERLEEIKKKKKELVKKYGNKAKAELADVEQVIKDLETVLGKRRGGDVKDAERAYAELPISEVIEGKIRVTPQYEDMMKRYGVPANVKTHSEEAQTLDEWADDLGMTGEQVIEQVKNIGSKKKFIDEYMKKHAEQVEKELPDQEAIMKEFKDLSEQLKDEAKANSVTQIQKEVIAEIRNMNIDAKDKVKFLGLIQKAKTREGQMRVLSDLLDRERHYYEAEQRKVLDKKIKKLLKQTKPVKKNGYTEGKYTYEENTLFHELREMSKLTGEIAMERLMAQPELSDNEVITPSDALKRMFLNYKAYGLKKGSLEMYEILYDELKRAMEVGREAKDEKDFELKMDRRTKVVEAIHAIDKMKFKGDADSAWTKALNVYRIGFSNIYSMLNSIAGKEFAGKYNPEYQESQKVTAVYDIIRDTITDACDIFGFENPHEFSEMIDKFSTEEYKVVEQNPHYEDKYITVDLNRFGIIDIYNAIKNEKTRADMYKAYGEANINDLVALLSEKEKLFADMLMEKASGYWSDLNRKYIELTGMDLGKVENYWPATSRKPKDTLMDNMRVQGNMPSSMKERSTNPVTPKPMDAWLKFTKHIEGAEHVLNLQDQWRELRRIFDSETVKDMIDRKYGDGVYKTLMQQINTISLNQHNRDVDGLTAFFSKVVGNWVKAKISLNPSVFLKQLISLGNYMEEMPMTTWTKYFAEGLLNPKATKEYMWERAKFLEARYHQGFAEDIARALASGSKLTGPKTYTDILTSLVRLGDIGSLIYGGYPVMRYLVEDKGMTPEEAEHVFEKASLRSQQSGLSSSLSMAQNSKNPFLNLFFAFKNTPHQYMRKMADAIIQYYNGEIDAKQAGKVLAIYGLIQPTIYALVSSAIARGWYGSDDDDVMNDVVSSILTQPFSMVPMISDMDVYITNALIAKVTGEKAQTHKVFSTPVIDDLSTSTKALTKAATGAEMDIFDYFDIISTPIELTTSFPVGTITRPIRKRVDKPKKKARKL